MTIGAYIAPSQDRCTDKFCCANTSTQHGIASVKIKGLLKIFFWASIIARAFYRGSYFQWFLKFVRTSESWALFPTG